VPVTCDNIGVTYFSVPKCACSSLKAYFHEIGTGRSWREEKKQGVTETIHERYPSVPHEKVDWSRYRDQDCVAVVRGPIPRLLSCYKNKVRDKNGLSQSQDAQRIERLGLPLVPTFDQFLEALDDYRSASGDIRRHTQPLSYWLGTDKSRYAAMFGIREIEKLAEWVEKRGGSEVQLRKLNRSKTELNTQNLSEAVKKKIRSLYAEDIEIFGPVLRKI
jgi:hypothetical protein